MKQLILFTLTIAFFFNTSAQNPKIKKNFSQPIANGIIKLDKSYFHYKNLTTKDIKEDTVNFKSFSEEELEIVFKNIPGHIVVEVEPKIIKPKSEGVIRIKYDASKRVDKKGKPVLGKEYKRIPIYIKGKEKQRNTQRDYLTVRTFIQEDFSHLSKRALKRAPVIEFDTIVFNFGEVPQGAVIVHDFVFTNKGKDNLDIRYAKGC